MMCARRLAVVFVIGLIHLDQKVVGLESGSPGCESFNSALKPIEVPEDKISKQREVLQRVLACIQTGHFIDLNKLLFVTNSPMGWGAVAGIMVTTYWTPLMLAINAGLYDIARAFLHAWADVNIRNKKGFTATMYAAQKGNRAILNKLLASGAAVNWKSTEGLTALNYAIIWGNEKSALMLIKKGAEVNNDALIDASFKGYSRLVNVLLKNGADANAQNQNGDFALHSAVNGQHKNMVSNLLKHGADVNMQTRNGMTPLMTAAAGGNPDILDVLLKKGARVNILSNHGNSALMFARGDSYPCIVSALLKHGAKINQKNKDGNTALIKVASWWGHSSQVSTLLKAGADPNIKGRNGKTALMHAAGTGKAFNDLLEHGAEINAQDDDGWTALMHGVQSYATNEGYIKELLKAGADADLENKKGKTAAKIAADFGLLFKIV